MVTSPSDVAGDSQRSIAPSMHCRTTAGVRVDLDPVGAGHRQRGCARDGKVAASARLAELSDGRQAAGPHGLPVVTITPRAVAHQPQSMVPRGEPGLASDELPQQALRIVADGRAPLQQPRGLQRCCPPQDPQDARLLDLRLGHGL
jgi:hypothetical protein